MQSIKTILTIALIIWSYYLVYALYLGIFVNPIVELGDGWDYHIPIARTILDGSFLNPQNFKLPQWYYPGSGQLINSFFLLTNIPITITNIVATILLFFVCFRLGIVFRLSYHFSLLFAITIVTTGAILRWYNDMSLDVLIAVFFVSAIVLLENPRKSLTYFLLLGFLFGLLIGSKYSAIFYVLLLGLVYVKKIVPFLSFARVIAFLIPFFLFGVFWYIRNYLSTQNPFYPLQVFGLPGKDIFQGYTVFNVALKYPVEMVNAFFSEYNIWVISIIVAFAFYLYKRVTEKLTIFGINRLYFIGISCLLLYFIFPTSPQPWIMVSSLRYSYPAFIPLILCVFLLAAYFKKETFIGYLAIGNMIMVLSMAFYPKLTLIYLPLALAGRFLIDKYEARFLLNERKNIRPIKRSKKLK